jgi:hypothetical protein
MEESSPLDQIDFTSALLAAILIFEAVNAILNQCDNLERGSTSKAKPLAPAPLLFCLMSSLWLGRNSFIFPTLICCIIVTNIGYLSKRSPLKNVLALSDVKFDEGPTSRDWYDPVMSTNIIYLISSVVATAVGLNNLALLHFLTFTGSTLYHINRERYYFNMDNIFAMTSFFVGIYSIYDSFFLNLTYFTAAAVALPIMMFVIIYCGMPADIVYSSTCLCCRRSSGKYDTWHSLWHVLSGLGPICYSIYYFVHHPADESLGRGYFDSKKMFAIVPVSSFLCSVCFNILTNMAGIAPLN